MQCSCSAGRLARQLSARHSRVSAGSIAAGAPPAAGARSPARAAAAAAAPGMPNVHAPPRRLRARLRSSSAVSAASALTCQRADVLSCFELWWGGQLLCAWSSTWMLTMRMSWKAQAREMRACHCMCLVKHARCSITALVVASCNAAHMHLKSRMSGMERLSGAWAYRVSVLLLLTDREGFLRFLHFLHSQASAAAAPRRADCRPGPAAAARATRRRRTRRPARAGPCRPAPARPRRQSRGGPGARRPRPPAGARRSAPARPRARRPPPADHPAPATKTPARVKLYTVIGRESLTSRMQRCRSCGAGPALSTKSCAQGSRKLMRTSICNYARSL